MSLRLTSFRARIFVLSLLVVGLTLLMVAAISWTGALAYEVDRLDARLCDEAHQLVVRPPQAGDLARPERDAALKLRLQSTAQLLLWLQPAAPSPAIHSARWPDGLDLNALDWRRVDERRPPVGPDDRPGGAAGDRDRPPRPDSNDGPLPDREPPRGAAGQFDDARPPQRPPKRPPQPPQPRSPCQVAGFSAQGSDWRAAQADALGATGVVAANLAATRTELREALTRISWRAAPLALVLTALGAWLMSTLAIRPVTRLRNTMESVSQQSLAHRLPADREDREFKDLVEAYNRMLDRLELSFHQATRFSSDAAHELRTPLTILQGQIEQALRLSSDPTVQVQLSQMLDEAGRLSSITRKLLLLSQADAGKLALLRTPVDLAALLQERLADALMLDLPAVRISSDLAPRAVVLGDAQLLGQAVNNLCSNAFKYTPPGGWIQVRVQVQMQAASSGVEVLWSNSTVAISPQARERLFDRFFRGDAAHNRSVDGHGLGLSLSRVIARAHGGDLTLEPSPLDEVRLRLWLPGA